MNSLYSARPDRNVCKPSRLAGNAADFMRSQRMKFTRRVLQTGCLASVLLAVYCGQQSESASTRIPTNLSKDYVPVKCLNGEAIREDRLKENAEVAAISDPYNPHHIIVAWVGGQGIISRVSLDGGRGWSPALPLPLTACLNEKQRTFKGGADESIAIGQDKTVYVSALVSYREIDRQALLVDTSNDGGLTWQNPVVVPSDSPLISDLDNTAIVADPEIPGRAYVVTELIRDESTSAIGFSRTTDGGRSWSPIRELMKPTKGRRFPGPQLLFEGRSKRIYAFSKLQDLGKSRIAGIYSDDEGVSWSDPIRIAECNGVRSETKLGSANIQFEPAQDMLHVVEDQGSGRIYLVFNDARTSNGSYLGIFLVSSPDRGRSWMQPITIGAPNLGHAFQPAVAVNSKHEIGVSYYDTRGASPEKPGKTLPFAVWLTIIGSRGTTSESRVDQFNYLGLERRGLLDYQALIAIDGRFHGLYTKTNLEPDEVGPLGAGKNVTDIFFSN